MNEAEGLRGPPVAGVEERDGAVIVELAGELDLYNAQLVREQLFEAAAREPERLIVGLSGVTFIDSTGLGVLIEARTRLANRRGFLLVGPGAETRRALEISGLDRHFAVHHTLDEALAASLQRRPQGTAGSAMSMPCKTLARGHDVTTAARTRASPVTLV